MADLDKFLKKNIEGYLFSDLRSIVGTPPQTGHQDAGVGYPLVMTAFAGIELLGALLSERRFNTSNGRIYFQNYWTEYLYPSVIDSVAIADALYQLARHGIAHTYLVKGSLGIVRRQPTIHLKHLDGGLVYIDAVQLAEDLIQSYNSKVSAIASLSTGTVNGETMRQRLNEIESKYNTQATSNPLTSFPRATVAESPAVSTTFVPTTSGNCFKP